MKKWREVRLSRNCYFIAKVVWAKGYHELLDVVQEYNKSLAMRKEEKEEELEIYPSPCLAAEAILGQTECGRGKSRSISKDDWIMSTNPSTTSNFHQSKIVLDVVATTTAEALAMGKFDICAEHPSNAFFATFENWQVRLARRLQSNNGRVLANRAETDGRRQSAFDVGSGNLEVVGSDSENSE